MMGCAQKTRVVVAPKHRSEWAHQVVIQPVKEKMVRLEQGRMTKYFEFFVKKKVEVQEENKR